MISIRRTRLIEVMYTLRVTVNNSIYVDLPVTLINFLSIDPPPMPGDGFRIAHPPIQQPATDTGRYGRPQTSRMGSDTSVSSGGNPAKASSTTLHLDALIQAGRARAAVEGQAEEPLARARPLSMGSEYTLDKGAHSFEGNLPRPSTGSPVKGVPVRPKGARMMSYLSTRSQSETSSMEGDDQDKALLAVRRAQGRQLSLAAIGRAIDRAAAADAEQDYLVSPNRESVHGDYFPAQTPMEEAYKIMGDDIPTVAAEAEQRSPMPVPAPDPAPPVEAPGETVRKHEMIEEVPEEEEAEEQNSSDGEEHEVGNETILEDLVAQHAAEGSTGSSESSSAEYGGYDYADEVEEGDGDESFATITKRKSLPSQLPFLNIDPRLSSATLDLERQQYIAQSRSINGSFATDCESEVGEVHEAIKRKVSERLPPTILPFDAPKEERASLSIPLGEPRRSSHSPIPTSLFASISSRGAGGRRGSAPTIHPYSQGLGMRRESSNPPVPSPLRPVEESLQARIVNKKSSFSFATPGSPMRNRASSISPGKPPVSFSLNRQPVIMFRGLSPRSAEPLTMLNQPSLAGEKMSRQPSTTSQLRHQVSVSMTPATDSDGEGGAPGLTPGLAPSVSDSASSDGNELESPPATVITQPLTPKKRALPKAPGLSGFTMKPTSVPDNWVPPDHLLHTSVNLALTHSRLEPASPPDSPSSSTHSILPSVRSKIAQLESRDEALRKFSVSASTQPQPSPERPSAIKRRSYTAALAPRPVRSASDDLDERDRLGGTTYVARKAYAEQAKNSYSPRENGGGVLRRHGSASSTSTSATAIEAALLGWGGTTRSGETGSLRSREMGSLGSRGYHGVEETS